MASRRIDDLNALDWDDSALIKAYNKGMSLQVKERGEENSCKERKQDSKKSKWKVGDFCRAVYPQDNLEYEAKIVDMSGDTCVIDFLGYNEEVEVDLESLSKSHGKQARKKQMKNAKEYRSRCGEESASGDDSNYSNSHQHRRNELHFNHAADQSANFTAAESSFQHAMYPVHHCTGVQPVNSMVPPPPPLPPTLHNPDMAQNPSLCAMLSSWYMAGYYTGLHQGQKNQCQPRCCHAGPNCCH